MPLPETLGRRMAWPRKSLVKPVTSLAVEGEYDTSSGVPVVALFMEFNSHPPNVQHRIHLRTVFAPFAERKLVHHAGDVDKFYVETGWSALCRQITNVLRICNVIARIRLQRLLRIAQGIGPGERIQKVQAAAKTMLQPGEESIVIVVAGWVDRRSATPRSMRWTLCPKKRAPPWRSWLMRGCWLSRRCPR